MSERSPEQESAHLYADTGWPVFPCRPGGKEPAIPSAHPQGDPSRTSCTGQCGRDGHGFHDATDRHGQIQAWWKAYPGANVAIRTGHPGPDVLDVDNHGQDANGFAGYNQLKREGLTGTPRAIIQTPHDGLHSYYKGTEQPNGRLRAAHIDFRGQGGYVVAPPSKVDGKPYVVVQHQASQDTFNWQAARQLLAPEQQRQPARPLEFKDERGIDGLVRWVESQGKGNRNDGLYWALNRAIEGGHLDKLDALRDAAIRAGHPAREADATLRSAMKRADSRFPDREAG